MFTGEDTKDVGGVPCAVALPGMKAPHHTILATDRVYYCGHAVAAVVARDRYLARDAADLVEVDYEPLPAVADPEKALEARRSSRASPMARQRRFHSFSRWR